MSIFIVYRIERDNKYFEDNILGIYSNSSYADDKLALCQAENPDFEYRIYQKAKFDDVEFVDFMNRPGAMMYNIWKKDLNHKIGSPSTLDNLDWPVSFSNLPQEVRKAWIRTEHNFKSIK